MQANTNFHKPDLTVREYVIDFTRLLYMQNLQIDQMIRNADQKAQVILGINAILIATLTNSSLVTLANQVNNINRAGELLQLVLQITTFVALLLSIFYAMWTVMPRYRPATGTGNHNFFGNIIHIEEALYVEQYLNMTIDEVKEATIAQIHAKSFVVAAKFRKVRFSLSFLALGIVAWGIVTIAFVG